MIWPQSNDSVDLLSRDEKFEGMEVLSKTAQKFKTTGYCMGVQGKDTDDMLAYARHAKNLPTTAIISRPPDTGKTQGRFAQVLARACRGDHRSAGHDPDDRPPRRSPLPRPIC